MSTALLLPASLTCDEVVRGSSSSTANVPAQAPHVYIDTTSRVDSSTKCRTRKVKMCQKAVHPASIGTPHQNGKKQRRENPDY